MKWRVTEPVVVAACGVIGLLALAANPPVLGLVPSDTWRLNAWNAGPGRAHLELSRSRLGSQSVDGRDYELNELAGLSAGQVKSIHAKVRFALERDAGTIVCEGVLMGGVGRGTFGFAPNATFVAQMRKLGIDDLDPDRLLSMALADVSMSFARRVVDAGLRDISAQQLIRFRHRNINGEYIVEIRRAGYDVSADELVRMKDHGVDIRYLRELKSGGRDFRVDEIVRLHDHGVRAEFTADLKRSGYELESEQIVRLHDHGVDADYLRRLKESAYPFRPDEIVRLRDHGVSADFPRQLQASGYGDLTAEQMIRMWENGVNGGYVAHLAASGLKNLSPEQIIKLKQHGID